MAGSTPETGAVNARSGCLTGVGLAILGAMALAAYLLWPSIWSYVLALPITVGIYVLAAVLVPGASKPVLTKDEKLERELAAATNQWTLSILGRDYYRADKSAAELAILERHGYMIDNQSEHHERQRPASPGMRPRDVTQHAVIYRLVV